VDDPTSATSQPVDGVEMAAASRPPTRRRSLLLVLGLAALIGVGAIGVARATAESCSPFARGECVRVLFLGNSYTYVNDLPAVFRHLAKAGGRNVETGMVANGGETLAQHAASPESLAAIRSPTWRFVIIQEQSEIPAIASVRASEMVPAAETLVGDIRAAAATPVLLDTWAHRDGLPGTNLGYAGMQAAIDEGYAELGGALGVLVVPAGPAWAATLRIDPSTVLWQADGSHPSPAGTYLVACVLYARLFDASPVGIPETAGLSSELARSLQAVAAQYLPAPAP
jgi:lysophospholipase L1-like esterase